MPAEPHSDLTLEARADLPCLERVHELVDQLWALAPGLATTDRYAFETAVIEVAGNIVEHGGPDVRLRLRLVVRDDRVEAHFCDTGRLVVLAESTPSADPLAEDGRGIALARAAADVVAYQRAGDVNRWLVVKRRSAAI